MYKLCDVKISPHAKDGVQPSRQSLKTRRHGQGPNPLRAAAQKKAQTRGWGRGGGPHMGPQKQASSPYSERVLESTPQIFTILSRSLFVPSAHFNINFSILLHDLHGFLTQE